MSVNENSDDEYRKTEAFAAPSRAIDIAARPEGSMGHPRPTRRRDLSAALDVSALALATAVAFVPILQNGFVN